MTTTTPVDSHFCPACKRIGSHAINCTGFVCTHATYYADETERAEAWRRTRLSRGQQRLDSCPTWCEGHYETGIASWEEDRTGVYHRTHSTEPTADLRGQGKREVASLWVDVDEHEDGTFDPALVVLDVTSTCHLTPEQARQYARDLLAAADTAESVR